METTIPTKRCKHCGCEINMDNASFQKGKYLRNECKPCRNALLRQYYLTRKKELQIPIRSNLKIFKDFLWMIGQRIKMKFNKIRD